MEIIMRKQENEEIGQRLQKLRLRAGLSKTELANILEVSVDHYRKLESGAYTIDVKKVINLYRYMGADPLYLLIGVSRKNVMYDSQKKSTEGNHVMQDLLMYCYENSEKSSDRNGGNNV